MRKKLITSLTILLIITVVILSNTTKFTAFAQEDLMSKLIVNGFGEITVTPNIAVINVGIETSNEDLSLAHQENTSKFENLKNVLATFNISETDIKTVNFNVYKEYNFYNGENIFNGYKVVNVVEVKTNQLDNLSNIISGLIENQANVFNGIYFTCDNCETYYLQALEKAVSNANDKASVLFGNDNYKILEISENQFFCDSPIVFRLDTFKGYENNFIFNGNLTIKSTVKVTYTTA